MSTPTPNDGGPAFPLQSIGPEFQHGYCGMTLRDWFAGVALQGVIVANYQENWNSASAESYKYADAMIAARAEN